MAKLEAFVTPSVMKWAREKAGYDIPTAAEKIRRPESDVEAWENGSDRPSMAQARRASEVYSRSLAVFYLPEPPKDFATLRDFRHMPSGQPREYSPELALLVRQVHVRQAWIRESLVGEKMPEVGFVGSVTSDVPPMKVAHSIRQDLSITPQEQMACPSRHAALRLWIDKAEEAGLFICRQSGIECQEARGFVLVDAFAPFIYLNSTDALVAQLFTLVHELAHVWMGQPGLSNLEGLGRRARTPDAQVEVFCNRVAAEALVDQNVFAELWASADAQLDLQQRVEWVSGKLKVSEEAVARRLMDRGQITVERYRELRSFYGERWRALRRRERARLRESPGGPSYYVVKVAAIGRSFTQTVAAAYHRGDISGRDASGLLGVKINHLTDLAVCAGVRTGMSARGDER